ncbi:transcriptional regulator, CopG family [Saccharicrinis carchari]|uniref:Putative nickel-responsive regulator n=1 Tax=Saccharicrinis carchari TaxID=1168039 RepID=A0A521AEC4_SACCC|nr:nickel-responsive transcriptional regulator NikR [Saccharicrinis carchari]SMO33164.1 transcriptional regulator, CopG family [Saccharicrinis carchari]
METISNTARFAVSLDRELLDNFDHVIEAQGYNTRSEAIRDLIRDKLVNLNWDEKEEAIGTITLVFNHHLYSLSDELTNKQHDHHAMIVSSMHVHLDHDNCLEIIAVKGKGEKIRKLADSLISLKGVKHGKLTLTTAGKENL